jgi:hypothetical protein
MFATGIVLDAIGGVWVVASAAITGAGCANSDCSKGAAVIGGIWAFSLLHLVVGIPLTVVGGRKVDPHQGWFLPTIAAGPRSGKAVWSWQF